MKKKGFNYLGVCVVHVKPIFFPKPKRARKILPCGVIFPLWDML